MHYVGLSENYRLMSHSKKRYGRVFWPVMVDGLCWSLVTNGFCQSATAPRDTALNKNMRKVGI